MQTTSDLHLLITTVSSPSDAATAWRSASRDAARAYGAWCAASRRGKPEAYAVYVAATDREDAAVAALRRTAAA